MVLDIRTTISLCSSSIALPTKHKQPLSKVERVRFEQVSSLSFHSDPLDT
jgi:hypothetical protein